MAELQAAADEEALNEVGTRAMHALSKSPCPSRVVHIKPLAIHTRVDTVRVSVSLGRRVAYPHQLSIGLRIIIHSLLDRIRVI